MWTELQKRTADHRDFAVLVVLVAAFRVMALALLRPGGFVYEWSGYYHVPNFVVLSNQGLYPFLHYWMEYPPIYPWLAVAAYRLSLLLPAWVDPRLWYNAIMGLALLPFDLGNLVLVYLIALKLYDQHKALRLAIVYALLLMPLFVWMSWMDPLPLFFLLLGTYLILANRPILAGLSTGVGFMAKLFPILLLPIGLRVWRSRKALVYAGMALLTILLIALPFLAIQPTWLLASFENMATRSSWETVWALLEGYYTGGVVAALDQHLDPAAAALPSHPSSLPWPWITAGFALIYLAIYLRNRKWHEARPIVAFAGLSLNLLLLYSRGYSPQFLIYVLPFAILLVPGARGIAYALLLSLANILEFPVALLVLPDQHWLLAFAVLARTLLLVSLSVEYALVLFPRERLARAQAWAFRSLAMASLVGSCVAVGFSLPAYIADRLAADPYREIIGFLETLPRAGVIVSDESLYYRFYPFLAHGSRLLLLGEDDRSLKRLAELASSHDWVWVVSAGTEAEQASTAALERWLSENAFPADGRWFSNARADGYVTGPVESLHEQQATLGHQVRLVRYALDPGQVEAGGAVRVRLWWEALSPQDKDYTVFAHVVGPDGRIVSQHDGQPGGGFRPTSSWTPGELILDNHGLPLSHTTPPGDYRLVVGMYDAATGQRLPVLDATGALQDDSIELGVPVSISPGK